MRSLAVVILAALALVSSLVAIDAQPAFAGERPPGEAGAYVNEEDQPTAVATESGGTAGSGGQRGNGASGVPNPTRCTWTTVSRDVAVMLYAADGRPIESDADRWRLKRCEEPGGGISLEAKPAGDAADPAALAAQALQSVSISAPTIRMSPPSGALVVQVPTWLWVDGGWWTTYSATATAGEVSSTVTATPTRATWTMGDGSTVTCDGPGTVWVPGLPEDATDCSYVYPYSSDVEPSGTYELSVVVEFGVDWTSNVGASGSLGAISRSATELMRVGEIQAIETM